MKISKILEEIGISKENDYFYLFSDNEWKKKIPIRLHKGLIEINPHSFLLHENKIIALFFIFTSNENVNIKVLFKKIWNLGGSPIIFIISEDDLKIYNGFSFDTKESRFDKLKVGNKDVTRENIKSHLSIWDIISGKTFKNLTTKKTQVDEKLLENLENTKEILINNGLDNTYAQNIIGRLIFSRYLLDRRVKIKSKYFTDKKSFLELIKNKELLYEYFDYLKTTFNGDLFPVKKNEIDKVNGRHLKYLYELFSGSYIHNNGIQKSLFEMYDFNIIPIELISEVYERFIGKENQKTNAAYYTPSFLVDYILEKTVKLHLNGNKACKVLDPSCGSGIFLVESLRAIIENNLDRQGNIQKEKLKQLLIENIFGIDIDENAINLTVFSLCLTLLDYVEPKDITKFKFPELLNKNLFTADFFDTEHSFNKTINNLDFIIGNPPWGSNKEELHLQYIKSKNIPISDKQIAQTFTIRTKDFSNKKTKCTLVLPSSSILYNLNAKEFRYYLLNSFFIKEILELSPVRNQIFSGAVAPTSIVFYQYSHNVNIENNVVLHTSVKPNIFLQYLKLIVIEKNDIKQIKQHYFIKYDYLWKIMLYGNVLDFYLIKRLKEEHDNLNQVIEKRKLLFGQGFIKGDKKRKFHPKHLLGKIFLDMNKKPLSKFYIKKSELSVYNDKSLIYRRGKYEGKIFKPPYVLLKKGFSKQNFSIVSAYTENEFVFTDSITAIKGKADDGSLLKNICGCLNSSLSSYHFLLQGSSAGIEREQGHNKDDRFTLPIIINNKISSKVDIIQNLYKQLYSEIMYNYKIESLIESEQKKLNELILKSFKFSDLEKSLIDYAIRITIPQINNKPEPLERTSSEQLHKYAEIFLDHFASRWNGNPNYFAIDIYYDNNIVGMNFKVLDSKPDNKVKIYSDKKVEELFQLIKLGEEKITDVFYKQRDIRGFNELSFYVIKANQYKNWHHAVAHGDLLEFVEAMLQAEKEIP